VLVVKITMLEGRTDEQKEALHERVAAAAAEHLGQPIEEVRTVIYDVRPRHWGIAGRSVAARRQAS
jgi:4-oxalocrotonate tautomerase